MVVRHLNLMTMNQQNGGGDWGGLVKHIARINSDYPIFNFFLTTIRS